MDQDLFLKRINIFFTIIGLIICAIITIKGTYVIYKAHYGLLLTAGESPNKKWRIELRDPDVAFADRNFRLELIDLTGYREPQMIFRSPDEEFFTTQRFLWSKDNTKVLMVGRGFIFQGENYALKDNEGLYFLYDLETKKSWCNCGDPSISRFYFEDIISIDFDEQLIPSAVQDLRNLE